MAKVRVYHWNETHGERLIQLVFTVSKLIFFLTCSDTIRKEENVRKTTPDRRNLHSTESVTVAEVKHRTYSARVMTFCLLPHLTPIIEITPVTI